MRLILKERKVGDHPVSQQAALECCEGMLRCVLH